MTQVACSHLKAYQKEAPIKRLFRSLKGCINHSTFLELLLRKKMAFLLERYTQEKMSSGRYNLMEPQVSEAVLPFTSTSFKRLTFPLKRTLV